MSRSAPRVVFFQANFPPSIDYPNARPVRLMLQRGLDVHVLAYGAGRDVVDSVPLWREAGLARAAARVLTLKPDLLFIETPTSSLALAALGRCAWVRSPVLSSVRRKAAVQRGLMRRVGYATFCNPAGQRPWALPPERVLDLPYPVDVNFWTTPGIRSDEWWTARQLTPPVGPVVVYVANFVAVKRQAETVTWLAPLLHRRPEARLVLAGRVFDPQVARDVEAVVHGSGLDGRVHLVGELPHAEVRDLYAWADAAVTNSLRETQCMALYEGLAAGVPALIRNIPQLTSAFPHLPAHDDGAQLRDNLDLVLDDPALRRALVQESRPRVEWADVARHDALLDRHLERILSSDGHRCS